MMITIDTPNGTEILRRVRDCVRDGDVRMALGLLREYALPSDNGVLHTQYARLAKQMSKQMEELPVFRVAFLANSTLAHWVDCLRFWLLLEGFRLEELLVPFGTWRQQVVHKESDLYKFHPEVVWFFMGASDLHFNAELSIAPGGATPILERAIFDIVSQVTTVATNLSALCMVNNIVPPANRIFGNFEGTSTDSLAAIVHRYNLALGQELPKGAAIFDVAHIAAKFGIDRWEDSRLWHHSKHPFALDAHGPAAFAGARMLLAARGRARKCLVLDLDNTLWGGVIGDDGIDGIRIGPDGGAVGEAYASFQTWVKALANRGIALAVCSKNNEDLAREAFLRKEGMILKLDDFVSFKANWKNKADNIRMIARELNLGLDSFVFVDDNPAERALVRLELPEVGLPEMPPDPADYVAALAAGSWFETVTVTDEDLLRARAYHENIKRKQAESASTDLNSYLSSLEMRSKWGEVDSVTLPRMTQLVNKTNQFHLTNRRYTEAQLLSLTNSPETWVGHFSLSDRFGDHGLIAGVVLRFEGLEAIIDTWVMSCRVFSREMENFTFKVIWRVAKAKGCRYLKGSFSPSPKNAVVADLYQVLGGTREASDESNCMTWSFDLNDAEPLGTDHIKDISVPKMSLTAA